MLQVEDHLFGYRTYETEYSAPDSVRFGVPTYRVEVKKEEDLFKHDDSFVIARIDASKIDLVQKACRYGFKICDTLVYWKGSVAKGTLAPGYWDRALNVSDAYVIHEIAKEAFTDYQSHYHADKRLDQEQIALGYAQWASEWKGEGIVIEHERCEFPQVHRNVIAFGLFTGKELTLAAVDPDHSGKGLYEYIVRSRNGEIEISTQVTNLAVQNVWAKCGLRPFKYVHTLHRWSS